MSCPREKGHSSPFKTIDEFIDFKVRPLVLKGLCSTDKMVTGSEIGFADGILYRQSKQKALVGCMDLRGPRTEFSQIYVIVCHRPQAAGPRREQLCRVIE